MGENVVSHKLGQIMRINKKRCQKQEQHKSSKTITHILFHIYINLKAKM